MGATSITAARMAGASAAKAAAAEAAAQGLAGQAAKEFVAKAVSKAAGRAATVGGGAMEDSLKAPAQASRPAIRFAAWALTFCKRTRRCSAIWLKAAQRPNRPAKRLQGRPRAKPHCLPAPLRWLLARPAAILGKMVAPVKPGWMGTSRTGGAIAGGIGEGLPEAVQGGAGQYAQNLAVKKYADETQDPMAGVADASAREGIGGHFVGMGGGRHPEARGAKARTRRKLAALQRSQRRRSAGRSFPLRWKVQKMHRIKARRSGPIRSNNALTPFVHSSKTAT